MEERVDGEGERVARPGQLISKKKDDKGPGGQRDPSPK